MTIFSAIQKKRLKRALPRLFGALAILFVTVGALGSVYVQKQLSERSQDTRSYASQAEGTVFIRSPQNGQTSAFLPDTARVLQLEIKTQAEKLEQIHLAIAITTDVFEPPLFKVPASGGLKITSQELEQTTAGYYATVLLEPKVPEPFSAPDWKPLLELHYTPVRGGSIILDFDPDTSKALVADTQLDSLKYIDRITYTVVDSSTATQQLPANIGGPVVNLCNVTCASNGECGLNQRCFDTGVDKRCRLASNTASTSCTAESTPTVTTTSPNKGSAQTTPVVASPRPTASLPPASIPPENPQATTDPEIEKPVISTTDSLTPDDAVAQQRSALDDFFAMIEEFDFRAFIPGLGNPLDPSQRYRTQQLLPYIALGVGILFVIIASGFFLRNYIGTRKRTEYSSTNSFESDDLSNQGDASQATVNHSQSAPAAAPPALPHSPIPRTTKHLGLQPASSPPSMPVHNAHNSAMLNRLKAKGVHPPKN